MPSISRLLYDRLVVLDERGMPQPGLAIAWHSDPGEQRWYFDLREDASFDDGTAAGSTAVAASLRAANPGWKVVPSGNGIVIERDRAAPDLPAELALERNSIVKREAGRILGSGSFRVRDWQPGRSLSLAAREDYWGGRAFLDAIEVVMGEDLEQQMLALSLGKADLIEVAAAPARATADNYRVEPSHRTASLGLRTRGSQSANCWPAAGSRPEPRSPSSERGNARRRRRAFWVAATELDDRLRLPVPFG